MSVTLGRNSDVCQAEVKTTRLKKKQTNKTKQTNKQSTLGSCRTFQVSAKVRGGDCTVSRYELQYEAV